MMNDKSYLNIRSYCLLCAQGSWSENHRGEGEPSLFFQGDRADSVYYLQSGRARLTVVSHEGKEATITFLSVGDFVGEESLARCMDCVWPRPLPSSRAQRSGSREGGDDPRDA